MKNKLRKGVMTVEASFVLPLVIFTIVTLAYICIYFCDTAMATGIIDRHLNQARINGDSSQAQLDLLKRDIQEDLNTNLIGTNSISVEIVKRYNSYVVKCTGQINIPIGWRRSLSFSINNRTGLYGPVGFIRNIRRVVEAT